MRRTTLCLVRSAGGRGFISRILGGKDATSTSENTGTMTKEQKEALLGHIDELRTDAAKSKAPYIRTTTFSDEMLDLQIDMDSIRARGVMKYRYNYIPPVNVKQIVLAVVQEVTKNKKLDQPLDDKNAKFKIISRLATELKHSPTNSRLLHLKKVSDVIVFYEEPVSNVDNYINLTREEMLPSNISMIEQPIRFHPEDTDAWHKGITVFPGRGGKVFGLRNQRIVRQFNPKSEWFDYEEQNFDYSKPDKDMPWDPEIAKKMDKYPDRRYSLKKKAFARAQ